MKHWPLIVLLCVPALALADTAPTHNSTIANSGSSYSGALSVNQAAGDMQQQSNARALAVGSGANAAIVQKQDIQIDGPDSVMNTSATIQGSAFSNGNGALGVNQSAGAATQQVNAMSISVGTGVESIDDSVLAQSIAVSGISGAGESATGERRVVTDDSAFGGSRGVVQLNQSAGVGNRMANSLSIRVVE
ncbi:adhesin [Pseudomonas sp. J237]|nr:MULTISPECIES: adhesin [Pseudomonas]OEO25879.1 adhesin [Pseudomonas sp. J237]